MTRQSYHTHGKASIDNWLGVLQVDELLNEARVDFVRADDVDEAIKQLAALLRGLPKRIINAPKGEAAKYLERMGMPKVCHASDAHF